MCCQEFFGCGDVRKEKRTLGATKPCQGVSAVDENANEEAKLQGNHVKEEVTLSIAIDRASPLLEDGKLKFSPSTG